MKKISGIVKKELKRIVSDKRLFFVSIFMPGIMIYIMYSLLGVYMQSSNDDTITYTVATYKMSENMLMNIQENNQDISIVKLESLDEVNKYKELIELKEVDSLIVFPDGLGEVIDSHDVENQNFVTQIEVFYNSRNEKSTEAYAYICAWLNEIEDSVANVLDINVGDARYDLSTNEGEASEFFSMLMPMLIMSLLFSACMSLAPDAIAGEKERGTMNKLLVTPIRRSELALGKILALSIVAMVSGLISCIGMILSIPKMFEAEEGRMSLSMYSIGDYICLLLVIFSTILVMISVTTILSANAKSIKEASTLIAPLMFVVMIIGCSGLFVPDKQLSLAVYMIPLFNSAQCFKEILSFDFDIMSIVVTVISNIVYVNVLLALLIKIFNSEKITEN